MGQPSSVLHSCATLSLLDLHTPIKTTTPRKTSNSSSSAGVHELPYTMDLSWLVHWHMVFRREDRKNKVKVSLTSEHWDFANLVGPGLYRITLCAAGLPALFAKVVASQVSVLETRYSSLQKQRNMVGHSFLLQKMNHMKMFLPCLLRHHQYKSIPSRFISSSSLLSLATKPKTSSAEMTSWHVACLFFCIRFRTCFRFVFFLFSIKKKQQLFICGFLSSAKMRFSFIHLHVSLGHLFVKLLGVNLTIVVYNAAFILAHDKGVQH